MVTVTSILDRAAVKYELDDHAFGLPIFLTGGLQLIGAYKTFEAFKKGNKNYHGWHAHHVFESQDIDRMHVSSLAPSRDDQLCVLLPERAHIGRITSRLREEAPMGEVMTARALLSAYKEAYDLVGDYCGGGELAVKRELVAIVAATLQCYGLM